MVQMQQINLLIFDECHHAKKNHPYNCIMKEFYFPAQVIINPASEIPFRVVEDFSAT